MDEEPVDKRKHPQVNMSAAVLIEINTKEILVHT